MAKKADPASSVKMTTKTFAMALDRIASDPGFRKELDLRPAETLAQMGVVISSRKRAELAGKRLSQFLPQEVGGSRGQVAETYVYVAVGVVIMIGTKVDETLGELKVAIKGAEAIQATAGKAKKPGAKTRGGVK